MKNNQSLAEIFVRYSVEGFHSWPDAPAHRGYLANVHRHQFHVEIRTLVKHDDREVEFHDLIEFARSIFSGGDLGPKSCEMIARDLAKEIALRFDRACSVEVSEDQECGALVSVDAPPQITENGSQ